MEIFYSDDIQGSILSLPPEETAHCVKVLRHRPGDQIEVIDGRGTLYHCTLLDPTIAPGSGPAPSSALSTDIEASSTLSANLEGGSVKNGQKCKTPPAFYPGGPSKSAKNDRAAARHSDRGSAAVARIDSAEPGWHAHPYRLTLAVCPTKNPDRYEWMAEKATEVGLDTLVPVIGDRSERKVLGKADRLGKILLSASKQSLKGAVPTLAPAISVRDFIAGCSLSEAMLSTMEANRHNCPKMQVSPNFFGGIPSKSPENDGSVQDSPESAAAVPGSPATLRLIAYCSDEVQPRASIMGLLRDFWRANPAPAATTPAANTPAAELPEIVVLIGPEGDFSPEEVRAAMAAGFIPVSLGASRLRTETAAVTAAEAVYLSLLE
ncbi:MAG: 16S rRNA (uracil(1498)-N(3))-methyltransferase [Bacteroidales bacterium]|nr:16S rRNA (uracil(1498)-N(3))-methyltransferase [Bacteroidales bacterium]